MAQKKFLDKDGLETVVTKLINLVNERYASKNDIADFVDSDTIDTTYATKDELSSYLTSSSASSTYVTNSALTNKLLSYTTNTYLTTKLNSYYTKTQVDNLISTSGGSSSGSGGGNCLALLWSGSLTAQGSITLSQVPDFKMIMLCCGAGGQPFFIYIGENMNGNFDAAGQGDCGLMGEEIVSLELMCAGSTNLFICAVDGTFPTITRVYGVN